FCIFIIVDVEYLIATDEVPGILAALLGWQCIAGTTQKNTRTAGTNLHITTALVALNICFRRLIATHTKLCTLSLGQLVGKIRIKCIQQILPLFFAVSDRVQRVFHIGGKAIVHKVFKTFCQPLSDYVTHFIGIETTVLHMYIPSLLNG